MNKKIISIAGLLFSLVFIGVFLMIWGNSRSIIKMEIEAANSVHETQLPFDITLFDNTVVSGSSLINIIDEYNTVEIGGNSTSTSKLKIYDFSSGSETTPVKNKQYRSRIHYNENGAPDGFLVEPL